MKPATLKETHAYLRQLISLNNHNVIGDILEKLGEDRNSLYKYQIDYYMESDDEGGGYRCIEDVRIFTEKPNQTYRATNYRSLKDLCDDAKDKEEAYSDAYYALEFYNVTDLLDADYDQYSHGDNTEYQVLYVNE